ncbi:Signal transduction histidine kinase [Pseudonocardia thermophila]|uniref:histidine kinase n=1 Tax=Pseudonocardia thermophila TaxID=1848 RepID=A0A1M6R1V9_PSETH|nr:sensor histidine kinase [Pseudonocardia thermophila]SHK26338.1 Signal transduction histidine kinase [Pseudonocardia thermophila]
MTDTTASAGPTAVPLAVRAGRQLGYHVTGLFLAVPAFVLATAGLSVGAGTLVVWIGIPVLAATLAVSRWFAELERRSTEQVLGRSLPPHHYRELSGGLRRAVSRLADPQLWRDLVHAIVAFPVRITTFVVAVTWVVAGIGELLAFLWMWALPDDGDGLLWLITGIRSAVLERTLHTVLGVVVLLLAPAVLSLMTAIRAGLASALLTNESAALRARAAQLESSRRSAVQAEAQTLRRLERDIHDGPQQRLVRLTMDLEAAARRLDAADPDKARALVGEALDHSREALTELRALSRGIAPPILADRGLSAALAAAAARSPVEVALEIDLPDRVRLADAVETTAYFVVTEGLANAAKHADASLVTVAVRVDGDRLLVQVRDDGRGGAHIGKGHGLAGLADRLATVEGALDVHSPPGGPTVLTAEIPLRGLGAGA